MATTGHVVDQAHGFGLTLPDGWVRIDLTTDLTDLISDQYSQLPAFAGLNDQLKETMRMVFAQGVAIFAIRTTKIDPTFVANLNVITLPSYGFTLDSLEALNVAQVKQIAINGKVSSGRVTFPAGEAVAFSYKVAKDGLPSGYTVRQYLWVASGQQYVLTVGGLPSDKSLAEAAKEMGQSFEIFGP